MYYNKSIEKHQIKKQKKEKLKWKKTYEIITRNAEFRAKGFEYQPGMTSQPDILDEVVKSFYDLEEAKKEFETYFSDYRELSASGIKYNLVTEYLLQEAIYEDYDGDLELEDTNILDIAPLR